MRTAYSRTYQTKSGYETRLYSSPVNTKNSHGAWEKIPAVARAVSKPLISFPSMLSRGTVNVSDGGHQVGFQPLGAADVQATRSAANATYGDAYPGVTVTETSTDTGLQEDFVLAGPSAANAFTESVSMPQGSSLSDTTDGGATVLGRDGLTIGTISAPVVRDANGATSTTAAHLTTSKNKTILISVDRTWLDQPGRAFPVTLDPDYSPLTAYNAQIESGTQATTNYGSASVGCIGNDPAHSNAVVRDLLSFPDLGAAIPRDAEIGQAQLNVNVASVGTATNVNVYDLTQGWQQYQATWNIASTGVNWTTAGGAYNPGQAAGPLAISSTDPAGSYHQLYINPAWVQSWLTTAPGTNQHPGFLLKATNESSSNDVCINHTPAAPSNESPYLDVYWNYRLGIDPSMQYFSHAVDGHESLSVNLANGNLVDKSTEFQDNAPGVPLVIARTYNSVEATQPSMNGLGWFTTPSDSGVYFGGYSNSDFALNDGSTYIASGLNGDDDRKLWHPADYTNTGSGVYAPSAGAGESLTHNVSTGDFTLTDNTSQTVQSITAASQGQLSSITSRAGLVETIGHNGNYTPYTGVPDVNYVTDTAGRQFAYTYGSGNQYITGITGPVINGAAISTSYTYQGGSTWNPTLPNGELLTAKDVNGQTTTYGYDSSDRVNQITSPQNHIVTISYYSTGQVKSLTYVTNNSTLTGNTWTFTYNQPGTTGTNGNTVVTDMNSHSTTYYWDPTDRIAKITDALGHSRTSTYSANNDPQTLTDALSDVTTLGYDNLNNLMSIQEPAYASGTGHNGVSTSLTYPTPGSPNSYGQYPASDYEPTKYTDAQGNSTQYSYNGSGLLSTVTPPSSTGSTVLNNHYQGETGYSCGGKAGELCASSDGNGQTTTYTYDSYGDATKVAPPAPEGATTYTYDNLGRVLTATDGKSQKTTYTYDNIGHITELQFGGTTTCTPADISSSHCITYGYDNDGELTSRNSNTGLVTFGYDLTGEPTSKSVPGSTATQLFYDQAGNVTSYSDAGGTVSYGYDAANELTTLSEPGGSCTGTVSLCTTFGYNYTGQRTTTTYPSGESVTVGYDGEGRETSLTAKRPGGTTFFNRTLTYQTSAPKDTSLVQQFTDTPGGTTQYFTSPGGTYTPSYDGLDRLTGATVGSTNYGWSYDEAGNRTSSTKTGTSTQYYGYNNANQLCWSGATSGATGGSTCPTTPTGDTGYTNDLDGNQTAGLMAFTYNSENQTMSAGGNSYTYADAGQTERASSTSGGVTTTFLNGILGLSGLIVGSGTPEYITRDPSGNPISLRVGSGSGSSNSYYLVDQQGSVLRLTDSTGTNDTATYTYDPTGTSTGSGTQVTANPLRYAGSTYDANGLSKLGARYDATTLSRWTQADPFTFGIANSGNLNGYTYAGDDPANVTDVGGLCHGIISCGGEWGTVGLIGGAITGCVVGALAALGVGCIPGAGALGGEAGAVGAVAGAAKGLYDDIFG